jgi:hypothetical protein
MHHASIESMDQSLSSETGFMTCFLTIPLDWSTSQFLQSWWWQWWWPWWHNTGVRSQVESHVSRNASYSVAVDFVPPQQHSREVPQP